MADAALPSFEYLTLPEAVASVCPPLPDAEVRRLIEEALCDGRLSEVPRPLYTGRENNKFLAMAFEDERDWALANIVVRSLSPAPASPVGWQSRFRDSRVDWQTGAVATVPGREETPVFSRQRVAALFSLPVAAHIKHPGGRPAKYPWKKIEEALENECKLQESIPRQDHSDQAWRTKSDAYRYIQEKFGWKDGGPSEAILKEKVGPILDRIASKLQRGGN